MNTHTRNRIIFLETNIHVVFFCSLSQEQQLCNGDKRKNYNSFYFNLINSQCPKLVPVFLDAISYFLIFISIFLNMFYLFPKDLKNLITIDRVYLNYFVYHHMFRKLDYWIDKHMYINEIVKWLSYCDIAMYYQVAFIFAVHELKLRRLK